MAAGLYKSLSGRVLGIGLQHQIGWLEMRECRTGYAADGPAVPSGSAVENILLESLIPEGRILAVGEHLTDRMRDAGPLQAIRRHHAGDPVGRVETVGTVLATPPCNVPLRGCARDQEKRQSHGPSSAALSGPNLTEENVVVGRDPW